jgi:hypothetical protein
VTINLTANYSGAISGTHPLLVNVSAGSNPSSGWMQVANPTRPFSNTTSSTWNVSNSLTTVWLSAYWSVSGSTTGPQGSDPQGAQIFSPSGLSGSSITYTLQ